jgi:hypothetical protein
MVFMAVIVLLWLVSLLHQFGESGHEVLHRWDERHHLILQPDEVLIVQYDSRRLDDYWKVSSQWNRHYADQYGHHYQFLTGEDVTCRSCDGSKVAAAWCKVKAMALVDQVAASIIRAVLFLDSDVLITVNYSMSTVISYMQHDLQWNISSMPIAFNQDGPGYACKQAIGLGYKKCFNSGTVLWFRHPISSMVLREWWDAASVPFNRIKEVTRFPMDWKVKVLFRL